MFKKLALVRDRVLLALILAGVLSGVWFWQRAGTADPARAEGQLTFLGRSDLMKPSPDQLYLAGDFEACLKASPNQDLKLQARRAWLYQVPFEWTVTSAVWKQGWLARVVDTGKGYSLQFFSDSLKRMDHIWKQPDGADLKDPGLLARARLELAKDELSLSSGAIEVRARQRRDQVFLFVFKGAAEDWRWDPEKFRYHRN